MFMYRQQQNKWYPQRCLLGPFKATFATAQIECRFYFAGDGTSVCAVLYLTGQHVFAHFLDTNDRSLVFFQKPFCCNCSYNNNCLIR